MSELEEKAQAGWRYTLKVSTTPLVYMVKRYVGVSRNNT